VKRLSFIRDFFFRSRPESKLISQLSYIFLVNLLIFVVVVAINIILNTWSNFHLIYYIIPLLLGYYTFHLRNYLDSKISEINEEAPKVIQLYKIEREKAISYLIGKYENEALTQLTKFTVTLIILTGMLMWLFSI